MNPPGLSLLTLNIGNPSSDRARRQLAWLASRDEHILVLTETKASAGCQLLADAFTAAGYHVTCPQPGPGEYDTMIISRVAAAPDGFGDQIGYLPARAAELILPAPGGPLRVIGMYVPSRDASAEKTEGKRKWLAACDAALTSATNGTPAIVAGDLNILEPGHQPRYPFFAPFEYDFYQALAGTHKVLADSFELIWISTTMYPRPRLILCLSDPLAAAPFTPSARSWAARAFQDLGVTISAVDLPADLRQNLLKRSDASTGNYGIRASQLCRQGSFGNVNKPVSGGSKLVGLFAVSRC
jgi:hypothetical protein